MSSTRRFARARTYTAVALVILVLGAAGSVFGASRRRAAVIAGSTQNFDATASAANAALDNALQRDIDLMGTVRALIETRPHLTNAGLEAWFTTLGLHTSFPGSFGLTYIERVPTARVAAFARTASADPPFGLHRNGPFTLMPATAAPVHCLTRFGVAQLPGGMQAMDSSLQGLLSFTAPNVDYCGLPIGTLLARAARSGRTEVDSLADLLARAGNIGFPGLQALPAFLSGTGLFAVIVPVVSPAGRAQAGQPVSGWMLGLFEAGTILKPLVSLGHNEAASLSFANPLGKTILLDRTGEVSGPTTSRTYRLHGDESWIATFTGATGSGGIGPNGQFLAVLLAGLLLSVLAAAFVRVLARSRARAIALADARGGELRHQALHDGLTGLPNRALMLDRTTQALERSGHDDRTVAVLFVDIDGFKDTNDSYGHAVGDELLRAVADRCRAAVPRFATVGRLGADEFMVLASPADAAAAAAIAERLLEALRAPFELASTGTPELAITASIGIASSPGASAEELMRGADIALTEAKTSGKNRLAIFEAAMHDALQHRVALELDLRQALARGEFFLQYQPIFDLSTMSVTSVEALLRWRHPTRGVIGPGEFVPLLESTGAIVEVGRFVLNEACAEVARWNAAGHDLAASVNVSVRQLETPGLVGYVIDALEVSGLSPELLVLEITESTLMRDTDRNLSALESLKTLGLQIAVDDFGTGYSSLAYLERFPVDSIKIDQSFVAAMESSREGRTLVHTLVQLGKALGLKTLAEGIEQHSQLERLRAEECDVGQGFLFARPLDPEDLVALLSTSPRRATRTEERAVPSRSPERTP